MGVSFVWESVSPGAVIVGKLRSKGQKGPRSSCGATGQD